MATPSASTSTAAAWLGRLGRALNESKLFVPGSSSRHGNDASENEEEGLRHVAQIHKTQQRGLIHLAEDVEDGQRIVDHGRADHATMLRPTQARLGLGRPQQGLRGGEGGPAGTAAHQPGMAEYLLDRNRGRIEGKHLATMRLEQERVDRFGIDELLAVPAERFEQAIERMTGGQARSAPAANCPAAINLSGQRQLG